MRKDDPEKSINPPHNPIDHEKPERERLRLYYYHKNAGTLGVYYEQYPEYRPPGREPQPRGRGGR